MMRHVLPLALSLSLAAGAAPAQEAPEGPVDEGLSLMEEGAQLLLRGLMDEVAPAMEDLSAMVEGMSPALTAFVSEMGPALADVLGRIDSLSHYEAPVILENGDIILRRRADAPEWVPPDTAPEPETTPEGVGPVDL